DRIFKGGIAKRTAAEKREYIRHHRPHSFSVAEDAEGRGRLFDELRNVRGCHRRSSQLHRRGLQHTQTTLSARLLEPRAIRGPLRSANGQNCRLILSSPRGALQNEVKKETSMNRAWSATSVPTPEVRQTPSGKTVASFIATNDNWRDRNGQRCTKVTPHEAIRADVVTVLRLSLDASQGQLLAGGNADPAKVLAVAEA